jgi:hypothetical protein
MEVSIQVITQPRFVNKFNVEQAPQPIPNILFLCGDKVLKVNIKARVGISINEIDSILD